MHAERGFAYITFDDDRSVDDCLEQYSDHRLCNTWVEVKRSIPRESIESCENEQRRLEAEWIKEEIGASSGIHGGTLSSPMPGEPTFGVHSEARDHERDRCESSMARTSAAHAAAGPAVEYRPRQSDCHWTDRERDTRDREARRSRHRHLDDLPRRRDESSRAEQRQSPGASHITRRRGSSDECSPRRGFSGSRRRIPCSHYCLRSLSWTFRTFYFLDSQDLLEVLRDFLGRERGGDP